MRHLTPDRFLAGYGPTWRTGVLSEHLEAYLAAGGVVRPAASDSGAAWAVVDGKAYPVVCSEVVPLRTEAGLETGRCGELAVRGGCCEGHAEQLDAWRAEPDTYWTERAREEGRL